jgi:dolichyl-diphosphooligosaccharide--protein glycosyltransferase
MDKEMTPTTMMARSLLYRLHSHRIKPGVLAPPDKFQEVYRSEYGRVRIFKIVGVSEESKKWVADPANRVCDAPGSWFCPGQYPPGLNKILSSKEDFRQLEDFNRESGADDDYQKQYFEDLNDKTGTSAKKKQMLKEQRDITKNVKKAEPSDGAQEQKQATNVGEIDKRWEDTEDTTLMWQLISTNANEDLKAWLEAQPHKAFIRSKDGRGPMFWSFEMRNHEATKLLIAAGVPQTDRDARGMTPADVREVGKYNI